MGLQKIKNAREKSCQLKSKVKNLINKSTAIKFMKQKVLVVPCIGCGSYEFSVIAVNSEMEFYMLGKYNTQKYAEERKDEIEQALAEGATLDRLQDNYRYIQKGFSDAMVLTKEEREVVASALISDAAAHSPDRLMAYRSIAWKLGIYEEFDNLAGDIIKEIEGDLLR